MTNIVNIANIANTAGVRFGTSGVRGLVAQMTDDVCYAYTLAYMTQVVKKHPGVRAIVLGHDLRPSSPVISAACALAINDAGFDVIYGGALPTPAVASYAAEYQLPAIIVTGSHIPFDRNGIKFYSHLGEITKADEQAIEASQISVPDQLVVKSLPAVNLDVYGHYFKRYVDFFGVDAFKGTRVAIYEHSSVARDILKSILEALGADVISLGRTDTFVPIDTEAVMPEDVERAKAWASQYQIDAIFSTDGDADRPLIADESGEWLRGDVVGVLCAKMLGVDVLVTPVNSNTIAERSGWFKLVVRTKIGSPYVIAAMDDSMQKNLKVSGYEANGGFLLGCNIKKGDKTLRTLPTRDAILPMLSLLALSKQKGCQLSELVKLLPSRYTHSNRIQNFPSEISSQLLQELIRQQSLIQQIIGTDLGNIKAINLVDGVRVQFDLEDVVHIRPSGNAPELRCYVESNDYDRAKLICDQCIFKLNEFKNRSDSSGKH
jgi:phosphomannomutase